MDIADLKIYRLEEYDQATLRKARERAKQKWKIFFKAITKPPKVQSEDEAFYEDEEDPDLMGIVSSFSPAKTYYKLWRGIWPTEITNK